MRKRIKIGSFPIPEEGSLDRLILDHYTNPITLPNIDQVKGKLLMDKLKKEVFESK
tara:strand:+ start:17108 stop:17275 length:168 start_codon:yes stop_codon:yes gene_type:complete